MTKFHCLVVSTLRDIGEYVHCNCLLTRLWRHEFWNYPYLFNQAVFSTWLKSHDKDLSIFRTKRTFKINQKIFFVTFKGLSMRIRQIFLEGESQTLKKLNWLKNLRQLPSPNNCFTTENLGKVSYFYLHILSLHAVGNRNSCIDKMAQIFFFLVPRITISEVTKIQIPY